jgi:hypothetical protein
VGTEELARGSNASSTGRRPSWLAGGSVVGGAGRKYPVKIKSIVAVALVVGMLVLALPASAGASAAIEQALRRGQRKRLTGCWSLRFPHVIMLGVTSSTRIDTPSMNGRHLVGLLYGVGEPRYLPLVKCVGWGAR